MNLMQTFIGRLLSGGGTGTDSDAVHYTADSDTSLTRQARARQNINAASADVVPTPTALDEGKVLTAAEDGTASWDPLVYVVTINDASKSIKPENKHAYKCGTLTSLTITSPPATGHYVIIFTSGSTATTTTIPSTIHGLESFAAEANTRYEIDVEDNYAVVGKWAVSA